MDDATQIRIDTLRGELREEKAYAAVLEESKAAAERILSKKISELVEVRGILQRLRALADHQAEDEGLWANTINSQTAYLQQELRKLHAEVERG